MFFNGKLNGFLVTENSPDYIKYLELAQRIFNNDHNTTFGKALNI